MDHSRHSVVLYSSAIYYHLCVYFLLRVGHHYMGHQLLTLADSFFKVPEHEVEQWDATHDEVGRLVKTGTAVKELPKNNY